MSFIETSALDSTNVEAAFQTILTGTISLLSINISSSSPDFSFTAEIHRVVSKQRQAIGAADAGDNTFKPTTGQTIQIDQKPPETGKTEAKKCC